MSKQNLNQDVGLCDDKLSLDFDIDLSEVPFHELVGRTSEEMAGWIDFNHYGEECFDDEDMFDE